MRFLGLKKIDWYIIKKFVGTYFFSIGLIIAIAIVFDISEKLDDFMKNDAPLKAIFFDYYMNFAPYFANLFSSLFVFISVIFFTSKMAYNTEIIAILSSGVSFRRIMYPYMVAALFIAGLSTALANFIIPRANKKRIDFEERYIKSTYYNREKNIHMQIRPGEYIYMSGYNTRNDMGYQFSMEKFQDGKLASKLISDYIKWDTTKNKWVIHDYYKRDIVNGIEKFSRGEKIDTTLNNITWEDFERRDNFAEKMDFFELKKFIAQQKLQGASTINTWLIEMNIRFAYPFSAFVLTIIGVALSSRKIRGGIGMHIGLGILLSFSYLIFMRFSTMFAIGGNISPFWASWIPNIVFFFISVYLYRLAPK